MTKRAADNVSSRRISSELNVHRIILFGSRDGHVLRRRRVIQIAAESDGVGTALHLQRFVRVAGLGAVEKHSTGLAEIDVNVFHIPWSVPAGRFPYPTHTRLH